jgi:nucleoside-diphosphate-sugar epimerase
MGLIQLIEKNVGRKAEIDFLPVSPGDMLHTSADISKAKALLDWTPSTTVEKGIELTVQWHLNNREWLNKIDLK